MFDVRRSSFKTTQDGINATCERLQNNLALMGIRLACQVIAEQDLQIVVLAPAPESDWRSLPDGEGRRIKRSSAFPLKDLPQQVQSPYGVAVRWIWEQPI